MCFEPAREVSHVAPVFAGHTDREPVVYGTRRVIGESRAHMEEADAAPGKGFSAFGTDVLLEL
jgi:hypothetical protein